MSKKLTEALRKHHIVYRLEPFGRLVERIIEHAIEIRKDGPLSVEKAIEDERNYLYRKLMGMMIDGVDAASVCEAGEIYIETTSTYLEANQKKLRLQPGDIEPLIRQMRMVLQGVRMIQEQKQPYLIEEVLFFYILGEARPASRFKKSATL